MPANEDSRRGRRRRRWRWALSEVPRLPEAYNFKYEPTARMSAIYTDDACYPDGLHSTLPPLPEPRTHTRNSDELPRRC